MCSACTVHKPICFDLSRPTNRADKSQRVNQPLNFNFAQLIMKTNRAAKRALDSFHTGMINSEISSKYQNDS